MLTGSPANILQVVTQPKPHSEWRQLMLLAIPTVFDLIATIFMNIGLLSVTASVYQMMRGAEMLFAALFSLLFLGRRLNLLHLGGIMCCVVSHCFLAHLLAVHCALENAVTGIGRVSPALL